MCCLLAMATTPKRHTKKTLGCTACIGSQKHLAQKLVTIMLKLPNRYPFVSKLGIRLSSTRDIWNCFLLTTRANQQKLLCTLKTKYMELHLDSSALSTIKITTVASVRLKLHFKYTPLKSRCFIFLQRDFF